MYRRASVFFALHSRDPEKMIGRLLDRALEREPQDIGTIKDIARCPHELLCALPDLSKARAIDALSRTAKSEGRTIETVEAGQALVLATSMPEEMIGFFNEAEAVLLERLGAHFRQADGSLLPNLHAERPLNPALAEGFCAAFLETFSQCYSLEGGVELQTFSSAQGPYGVALWDEVRNKPVVQANLSGVNTLGGLARLVVTLGHEAMHCMNRAVHRADVDWEGVRREWPEAYIYKNLTDPVFYSSKKESVYCNHPEEIFVERVGLRLGVKFAHMLGLSPKIDDFARESLGVLPRGEILRELSALFSEKQVRPGSIYAAPAPMPSV